MPKFFVDSESLQRYVKEHDTFTWHGSYGIGSLEFIDSDYVGLHVVFHSRRDYEKWRDAALSQPEQICLY